MKQYLPIMRRALVRPSQLINPTARAALLWLAVLLTVPAFAADTGTIEGRVGSAAGRYLENARVRLVGTDREAFTNQAGEYRLASVPAGGAVIEIFYTGLALQRLSVDVAADAVARRDATLAPAGAEEVVLLDAFVVQADREMSAAALAINEQRFSANLKNVVSTDAYGEISQGNIGEFLKHVPGVTVEYNGNAASGVQVRGFNSNFTMVTLDGGQLASSGSSLSTQNHTRSYSVDQTSINNLSRLEVVKLPTPDLAANLMGGAVNLVSKSAFERTKPELRFSSYLSMNGEAMTLGKTPGPGSGTERKIRPSGDVSYVLPINDRFGVVVTASSANQFYRQQNSTLTRTWSANGATAANPATTAFKVTDTPSKNDRNSAALKLDWKPAENHRLSLAVNGSATSSESASHSTTYNVGTADAWGETSTTGRTGSGSVSQGHTYARSGGTSLQSLLNYTYTGRLWKVEAAGNVSRSRTWTRDTARGGFGSISTATDAKTVSFTGIDNDAGSPGTITVRNAAGNALDMTSLANYRLTQVGGTAITAEDTIKEARLGISREIESLPFRLTLKAGGTTNELRREIDYTSAYWTYVGADGIANNADNALTSLIDPDYSTVSPGLGYPSTQYASPWAIYQLYKTNPAYFTRSASQIADTVKNEAVRSPIMQETVTAGYFMADARFFRNRVRLVGGVRHELTEDEGWGYLQTLTGYVRRGTHVKRDYEDVYPSAHLTVNLTENLLFRAAYAKTLGRPRLSDIVPNMYVGANSAYDPSNSSSALGWVVSSNTTLKPWTADNFDLSLEYYLPRNGVLSAGVFRKDIRDFFGSVNSIVDAALAAELGLGDETIGYTYTTRINAGDARIDGLELGYSQALGKHFTVFANGTKLNLSGSKLSDFSDFIPKTANLGFSWSYKRLSGMIKENYRGKQRREYKTSFTGAAEYIRARATLDANIEYQLTKHFAIFAAGRNLTNEPYEWEISGDAAPAWSSLTSTYQYGAQYSFGFKGSF